jgi:hypothetical protein
VSTGVLQRDPPELIRGDDAELPPELLADRDRDAMPVVFQKEHNLRGRRYPLTIAWLS